MYPAFFQREAPSKNLIDKEQKSHAQYGHGVSSCIHSFL